jgi:hypothetical protein
MSLRFKLSFDLSDFEDEDFLNDLKHINNFYNKGIELEYKAHKEKIFEVHKTLEEIIETITQNNIQFGNLIFYNFDIPAIKKKLKERNL